MTNRVEDLESRVSELEATVKGLTEELVLANDRIRELEGGEDTRDEPGVRRRNRVAERRANSPKTGDGVGVNDDGIDRSGDGDRLDDIIIA